MKIEKGSKLSFLIFYWLPVILLMFFIFFASSQPYEKQDVKPLLSKIVNEEYVKENFSHTKFHYDGHEISIRSKGVSGFIEFFIRKAAHLTEYACLGFLLLRAFYATTILKRKVAVIITLLISFIYACSDEFHQMITPHRTPLFTDVMLDSLGVFIGMLLFLGMKCIFMNINGCVSKKKDGTI